MKSIQYLFFLFCLIAGLNCKGQVDSTDFSFTTALDSTNESFNLKLEFNLNSVSIYNKISVELLLISADGFQTEISKLDFLINSFSSSENSPVILNVGQCYTGLLYNASIKIFDTQGHHVYTLTKLISL